MNGEPVWIIRRNHCLAAFHRRVLGSFHIPRSELHKRTRPSTRIIFPRGREILDPLNYAFFATGVTNQYWTPISTKSSRLTMGSKGAIEHCIVTGAICRRVLRSVKQEQGHTKTQSAFLQKKCEERYPTRPRVLFLFQAIASHLTGSGMHASRAPR